ncbi:uncharacterized protein LOC144715197 [Wolffia australiana]
MRGEVGRHRRAMAPLNEAARQRLWGIIHGGIEQGKIGHGEEEDVRAEFPDLGGFFYVDFEDNVVAGEETRRKREIERLSDLISSAGRDLEGGRIVAEAECAWRRISVYDSCNDSSKSKRRLMRWLRESGFDAGFCRSYWDETVGMPPAAHEYVDVACASGRRYIIDCDIASEFEIARPTPDYQALLLLLPEVFVGTTETLRDVVGLLCSAAVNSMHSMNMHIPPWRRESYVQGKWFGPYRRAHGRRRDADAISDRGLLQGVAG